MILFTMTSPDVWGNARDGYEVNEEYPAGELKVYPRKGEDYETAILRALRRDGHLVKGTRTASIEIRDDYPIYTVSDVRSPRIPVHGDAPDFGHGKPVFFLECVEAEEEEEGMSPSELRKEAARDWRPTDSTAEFYPGE